MEPISVDIELEPNPEPISSESVGIELEPNPEPISVDIVTQEPIIGVEDTPNIEPEVEPEPEVDIVTLEELDPVISDKSQDSIDTFSLEQRANRRNSIITEVDGDRSSQLEQLFRKKTLFWKRIENKKIFQRTTSSKKFTKTFDKPIRGGLSTIFQNTILWTPSFL